MPKCLEIPFNVKSQKTKEKNHQTRVEANLFESCVNLSSILIDFDAMKAWEKVSPARVYFPRWNVRPQLEKSFLATLGESIDANRMELAGTDQFHSAIEIINKRQKSNKSFGFLVQSNQRRFCLWTKTFCVEVKSYATLKFNQKKFSQFKQKSEIE